MSQSIYDAMGLSTYQEALSCFEGYCIAYFRHEVLVGEWTKDAPYFEHAPQWHKLLEIHIFDSQSEYRAIRTEDGGFMVRVRCDQEEKDGVFDEAVLIIGNSAAQSGEGFFAALEKGRCIFLPKSLAQKSIVIRNYLSFEAPNEQDMPGCEIMRIADWRFAGFVSEEVCSGV